MVIFFPISKSEKYSNLLKRIVDQKKIVFGYDAIMCANYYARSVERSVIYVDESEER